MNDAGRLAGRVAIVTGAAQGIGAEYAKALAAEGAALVVMDVLDTGPVCQDIVAAGGRAIALKGDVTSSDSMDEVVAKTIEAFGTVDILVNNAALFGNLAMKPFEEITSDEWDRVMAVNVRGVFEASKAVVPEMRRRKYGKIINIASGTVLRGLPLMTHYVTSKGAIVAMSRCLARELGGDGIRVNTLAPGLVLSENVVSNPAWQGAVSANIVASRSIRRDQLPSDLVGSLVYLCCADSDFVTGQMIVVDGGSMMH